MQFFSNIQNVKLNYSQLIEITNILLKKRNQRISYACISLAYY